MKTPEELRDERNKVLGETPAHVLLTVFDQEETPKFTCDNCKDAPECEYVFDLYNTHGSCLAEK